MTLSEEAERELKVQIMQADLELKKKQVIWETPRNLAIVVGAVAAIAGVLGFKLGQQSPPTPVINVYPVMPSSPVPPGVVPPARP
jgi:hypothetical protein